MSIQITRLMKKEPQIFYDVSYEDGDGIWLYMNPGWYCCASDTGTIHEHTVTEILWCAKNIYQDKDRWISEHPTERDEIKKILAGDYDVATYL